MFNPLNKDMNNDFENIEEISSEIRFLTLELMKLARKQGKTFDQILEEFIANAYSLQGALEAIEQFENKKHVDSFKSEPSKPFEK